MQILPAIDILEGRCVRLRQGDYADAKIYEMDPIEVSKDFRNLGADFLHIVDLDGAKKGLPTNAGTILEIAKDGSLPIQVGGGIRNFQDASLYLKNGVNRIILSTSAVLDQALIKKIIQEFGGERLVISVDVVEEMVAIRGWTKNTGKNIFQFLEELKRLGIQNLIVTDISRDGMLEGPNLELISEVVERGFRVIAAGGISTLGDLEALKQIGCFGAIIGKAIYEKKLDLEKVCRLFNNRNTLTKRIIPCLDIAEGRVKKGTFFKFLKDVGDPVEMAKKYEQAGADELVFLDITATNEKREILADLVAKVAKAIAIPFTVGGGIKDIATIRQLLSLGADKISIGSAAIDNPSLISEAAENFGSQCVVVSLDVKRTEKGFEVFSNGGRIATGVNALKFAKEIEQLGAGEILVNSLDRDGTNKGYDLELLSNIVASTRIPVVASSGAGSLEDFAKAFEVAKVDAVLAASVFHYDKIKMSELKDFLFKNFIPVRL